MRIGGGSVNLRLDLRWKNDSGKTIVYGQAFELYQMKDGGWQKVTPARQVDYPAIQYSLPSGMDNELSYDLTVPYNLIAGERYRLQTEFRYEEGTEYSEPMANWVEFEVKMNLPYKEAQPSAPITIPELQVNAMSGAMGETDEITASPCAYYWQAPEPNEDMKPTILRGMISQSCCQIRSRLFWAEDFFCVCGRRIKDTGAPVHCMGCFRLLI